MSASVRASNVHRLGVRTLAATFWRGALYHALYQRKRPMVYKLTISVPDDAFAALQSAAASASGTPEELASEAVAERFASPEAQSDEEHGDWRTALRDVMRSRGHLVEAAPRKARLGPASLPPRGSPERLALEEELSEELGAAFEQSGHSVLDLVERR